MPHTANVFARVAAPLCLLAAALPACSPSSSSTQDTTPTPPESLTTTESGFLRDYSLLQTNPLHPGSRIWRSPSLSGYKSFIVLTPSVLPSSTVRGTPITPADSSQLAAELKAATIEALDINFTIVQQPAQGVATVRSALTKVAYGFVDPASGRTRVGGASVEMQIVDSLTGEPLAAAVESDAVTEPGLQQLNDTHRDARLVFQHWAARLASWLSSEESKPLP